jgi:methionine synthase II (cobalamin-independent)
VEPNRPDAPIIPNDLLEDIKSAYNDLVRALEAAGLPRPPSWT